MPKRDATYMQKQRDLIAKAAFECLIEKGVYETSLRDICKQAGVSIGALYTHFETREDLILAACSFDDDSYEFKTPPQTWQDFERAILETFDYMRTPHLLRRFRLSVQFVAELMLTDKLPKGLAEHYHTRLEPIRAALSHLHSKGEITLPLGLDETTMAVFNHLIGTRYVLVSKGEARKTTSIPAMLDVIAQIAGRKHKVSKRLGVPAARREGVPSRAARN